MPATLLRSTVVTNIMKSYLLLVMSKSEQDRDKSHLTLWKNEIVLEEEVNQYTRTPAHQCGIDTRKCTVQMKGG